MWPFNRNKKSSKNIIARGFTDWHSHILPGVDDGVQTMDESIEILKLFGEAGVSDVWLTPHIMEDIPNTTAFLRERFSELQEAYDGPVKLHLGAENMLDNLFAERLAAGDLLPIDENRLLVETSYFNPPMDLEDILQKIRSTGYVPVLAHPERYMYMDRDDYKRLKSAGTEFQMNVTSLAGFYGSHAKSQASWLKAADCYSYAGTDTHSLRTVRQILG